MSNTMINAIIDDADFRRRTSSDGFLKINPRNEGYWTWLGGPIWRPANGASVRLMIQNYESYSNSTSSGRVVTPTKTISRDESDGYLDLGEIRMKRVGSK